MLLLLGAYRGLSTPGGTWAAAQLIYSVLCNVCYLHSEFATAGNMVRYCVFPNCPNKLTTWTKFSFHRLPLRDLDLLKLWLVALKMASCSSLCFCIQLFYFLHHWSEHLWKETSRGQQNTTTTAPIRLKRKKAVRRSWKQYNGLHARTFLYSYSKFLSLFSHGLVRTRCVRFNKCS